jgi:signal peptidase II
VSSPRSVGLVAGTAVVAFVVDQASKSWARSHFTVCQTPPMSSCDHLDLPGPLQLARVGNAGSALGFGQGLLIWTVIAGAALMLLLPIARRHSLLGLTGASMLAAGALGNLLDRVLFGAVTDFIDAGDKIIFNLADLILILGCLLSTLAITRQNRRVDPTVRVVSHLVPTPTSPAAEGGEPSCQSSGPWR